MPKQKRTEAQKRADEKYEKKRAGQRARNWAFIIYPESAPENWREILDGFHVPAAVSPIHDQDVNANGEPKKPHYHIVLAFDANKTRDQVLELVAPLRGTTVIKLNSLVGMLRYLTHADNPEKAQYDKNDVETFGGLQYFSIIENAGDKIGMLSEIMEWIDDNACTKYAVLMRYARKERPDWFELLCMGHTIVISEYIKSVWQEVNEENRR